MKQRGTCHVQRASVFAVALIVLSGSSPPSPPVVQNASQAALGRALFTGQARMQNGGLPCGACHAISGLRFPNGGVVGPDLSGIYQTLGPDGTDAALQTLFFPTMMPLYEKRPLTPGEQQALKAFLAQAGTTPVGARDTLVLGALVLGGFLILIAITWLAWRGRLRGVRAPLVARAEAGGTRA